MTKRDIARATKMIEEIGTEKAEGFVFVVKQTHETGETYEADGIVKLSYFNKAQVLRMVIRALDLDEKDLIKMVLLSGLGKDD